MEKLSRFKSLLGIIINSIKHPVRVIDLLINVKKIGVFKINYVLDNFYLHYGKIKFKNENKPLVSIIIPVYNQVLYTAYCLRAIYLNTYDVSYEIIIADDVSDDDTRYINKYFENIKVIRNTNNKGFLLNCNNAAKHAKGKYILFLNNDTSVKENWLKPLVDTLENNGDIGLVGSKLVFPDGRLQEAGGVIFNDGSAANYGKFDDASKPEYNYLRDVDYISGASIMLKKELWNDIGGFDKRFAPAYCEDSDLAFEVRKRKLRVVYQPLSVVTHYEGVSNGVDINCGLKKYQLENCDKLLNKWYDDISKLPSQNLPKLDFSIRDRMVNKKTILVIDHYVPEFDKDAGSKTTFQYLKMFVKMGFNVKFLGDNFYNKEPYTTIVEQMGIEVLYGPAYANNIFEWILINQNNIDIAYVNRPHIASKYIDFIKNNTNIKIIYYGHDLHYLRELREYELNGNIRHKIESEKMKKIEYDIMRKVDMVYYPSSIEKDEIHKNDSNINVKAIKAYYYDKKDIHYEDNIDDRNGILFVGGFTHRPNVDAVLWFVKEVYPKILAKKNIKFIIVGSNPPDVIKNLTDDNIAVKGYVSDEELAQLYKCVKMTIAPLRYGAGIKGKVIESASFGVPMVTTSIGAEGLENYDSFLTVADDSKKMAMSIVDLYEDNSKLIKISKQALNYIDSHYSMQAAWDIIKEDFNYKNVKNESKDFNLKVASYFADCNDKKMLKRLILSLIDNNFDIDDDVKEK